MVSCGELRVWGAGGVRVVSYGQGVGGVRELVMSVAACEWDVLNGAAGVAWQWACQECDEMQCSMITHDPQKCVCCGVMCGGVR